MKKTPWILGAATVCVVAIGGGGTAFAMSSEAQINVYGEQSSVRTFSSRPSRIFSLIRASRSRTPTWCSRAWRPSSRDGMDIQVVQRTPVTVTVDGAPQELLTTGDTVADVLEDAEYDAEGAAIAPAARDRASPRTEGEVEVITQKTVTFVGQYGEDTFEVTALTVGDAMEKVLGDIEDTDTADVPGHPARGRRHLHRPARPRGRAHRDGEGPLRDEDRRGRLPVRGHHEDQDRGQEPGSVEKVFAETTVDGEVTESELVSEDVVTEPVTEVVAKGTKEKPAPEPEPKTEPKLSPSPSRERTPASPTAAPSVSPPAPAPAAPRAARARVLRPPRRAPCGTASPSASPAATGRSTPATATTAACSSSAQTWNAFGGGKYASTANQASRGQQIDIAKKVQAQQGWGAWPSCTSQLGIR